MYPSYKAVLFVRSDYCPFCDKLKKLLENLGIYYEEVKVEPFRDLFIKSHATVPQLYVEGKYRGDYASIQHWFDTYGDNITRNWIIEGIVPNETSA